MVPMRFFVECPMCTDALTRQDLGGVALDSSRSAENAVVRVDARPSSAEPRWIDVPVRRVLVG